MANRNAVVSAGPASVGSGFPIPTKMKRDTAETTVDMMYPARGLHQRVNRLRVYSVSNGVPSNSAKTSPAVIDSRTLDARTKSADRRPRIGIRISGSRRRDPLDRDCISETKVGGVWLYKYPKRPSILAFIVGTEKKGNLVVPGSLSSYAELGRSLGHEDGSFPEALWGCVRWLLACEELSERQHKSEYGQSEKEDRYC